MRASERTTKTIEHRYNFFCIKTSLILIETHNSEKDCVEYSLETVHNTDGYMCQGSDTTDLSSESFDDLKKVLDAVQTVHTSSEYRKETNGS